MTTKPTPSTKGAVQMTDARPMPKKMGFEFEMWAPGPPTPSTGDALPDARMTERARAGYEAAFGSWDEASSYDREKAMQFAQGVVAVKADAPIAGELEGLITRLRAKEFDDNSARAPYQRLRNPDGPEAATAIASLQADKVRKDEALRRIVEGATLGKQMFAARMEGKKSLTWHAVNVLQDNLDACQGTALAALNPEQGEKL